MTLTRRGGAYTKADLADLRRQIATAHIDTSKYPRIHLRPEKPVIDTATGEVTTLTSAEQTRLGELETRIEAGLKTFVEVGAALLEIRDNRLYRDTFATFEAYCAERWQFERRHAYRLMDAAKVVENVSNWTQTPPANEAQARPLTELEPEAQRVVWEIVQQTAPAGKVTAAHVKSVATVFKEVVQTGALDGGEGVSIAVPDVVKAAVTEETYERLKRQEAYIAEKLDKKPGVPAALQSSESNEWYTPARYVDAARRVMGGIDLDPASNPVANRVVMATHYFTIEDDGLAKTWAGRVWLNPPYGRDGGESNQATWSARLLDQYQAGNVAQAVLLVNAVTDRVWFQPLWAFPICFTDHRIRFYDATGAGGSPTHGNALVYLGANRDHFASVFSEFGPVVMSVIRRTP